MKLSNKQALAVVAIMISGVAAVLCAVAGWISNITMAFVLAGLVWADMFVMRFGRGTE